jgi:hypothetical protein
MGKNNCANLIIGIIFPFRIIPVQSAHIMGYKVKAKRDSFRVP